MTEDGFVPASGLITDGATVLVTGASGFLGRHLVPYLAQRGYKVVAASRTPLNDPEANATEIPLPDLSTEVDWRPLLAGCDAVVHLAGVAHSQAVESIYDLVNDQATAALVRDMIRCGTKHLIFVSSVAVLSGRSSERIVTEDDPPAPSSAYGRSKLAAENAIRAAGISFTILRPVVVYGIGEKETSQSCTGSRGCLFLYR
jgi:nucleoside-diphosphate-sugar epimerase